VKIVLNIKSALLFWGFFIAMFRVYTHEMGYVKDFLFGVEGFLKVDK